MDDLNRMAQLIAALQERDISDSGFTALRELAAKHPDEFAAYNVRLVRHHTQLEPIARDVWGTALRALNYDHTRQALQTKLLELASGMVRDEQRWVASRGLAWSGYGGGVG